MRPPLDRDFLRTKEDLIFCVIGYLHPEDRVTAYLKYVPSPGGKWSDGKKRYERAFPYYSAQKILETFDFLKTHYPHYVSFCPVRNLELSMVPREYISQYYPPEERMDEISRVQNDALERDIFEFVSFLCEQTGVEQKDFGITGSVLTHMHNPTFSDMDILIYGREASLIIKEALREMRHLDLREMNQKEKERWVESRTTHFPISRRLAAYYLGRRWNFGYFKKRYFSLHPTHKPEEVGERYGQRVYRQLGRVRLRGIIIDASDSIFLPAVYEICDVEVLEGENADISFIISFEGLFCDIAKTGDMVEACGMLERSGNTFSVVVGAIGIEEGWIKVLGCE
jgi:predicted nucleotidyltransferase